MNPPSHPGWDREIAELRRTQQQLRESEERYRLIVESAFDAIITIDHQGLITEFNPAAEAIFGWKRSAMIGRDLADTIIPAPMREGHRRGLERHRDSTNAPRLGVRLELPALRADGSEFPIELTVSRVAGDGLPKFTAIIRDLTGQLRAAHELRHSEARFRALTELSADWFWEQDENFRFVEIDAGGRYPLEIPPAATILGKTRWDVEGSEPADGNWDPHRAQLQRHEPFRDFELRRRAADGTERILSIAGSPVFDAKGGFTGYRGVGRDITDSRRAEQALRESQRALAALMGNLPGMAYRGRNDSHWTLEFVSEGAHQLTGHRPEALISGSVSYASLIHPDDRDKVWVEIQAGVAHDRPFQLTYRISTALGEEKWVWERGSAVREPGGNVVALEGFVSDITERKRAQEEVARLNAELEERVRRRTAQLEAANAELEAFSYSIAHDLRSPLTSIDGFSHMLDELAAQSVGDQGRHYLRRIRAGVRQMSDLTDAMLSLAHLSRVRLRWEPVDLAAIARSVEANLREGEPERVATIELPDHLHAQGDPRLLTQVIANLLGNAWKFSADKPRTLIRIGSAPGENGEPVYFVADHGAGFDMAHASRLFGAFQRLHASSEFEGTGIGLALVQKIVLRHAGRIWADARPGDGATFYFTLSSEAPS